MRSRRRRHQTRQDSNADRTREAHAHSTARVGDLPIHVLLLHGGYAAVPCVYESRLGSKPRSRQDSNGGRTREAHAHSTARAGHHTTHLLLLHGDDAAVPCACVKFRHNCMKSTPRHGWFAKPVGISCQKKTCQTPFLHGWFAKPVGISCQHKYLSKNYLSKNYLVHLSNTCARAWGPFSLFQAHSLPASG
jgi:hypothetical protein